MFFIYFLNFSNTKVINSQLKQGKYTVEAMRDSPVGMVYGAFRLTFHRKVGAEEMIDRQPGDLKFGNLPNIPILLYCERTFSFHTYNRGSITLKEKEIEFYQLEEETKNEDEDTPVKKALQFTFSYSEIIKILVQNFEGHVGIRGATADVQFFSSYNQIILNEIILRSPQQIDVQFGRCTRNFDYGSETLRNLNPMDDKSEGAFYRPTFKLSETVMKNVPKKVREDLQRQEEAISNVQNAVDKMIGINKETKEELERQNRQLTGIHTNTDAALHQERKAHHNLNKYHG